MLNKKFESGHRIFTVSSEKSLNEAEISLVSERGGVLIYRFALDIANTADISDISLFWDEMPSGITGFWAPCHNRNRLIPQGWYAQRQYSTLTDGIPLVSLFSADSGNYLTCSLSDAETPFEFSVWLRNDPGKDTLRIQINPFKNEKPSAGRFSFLLRIDERKIPFTDSVSEASEWMRSFYPGAGRTYSDDFAGDRPLFSSWYACFQNPEQQTLERELPVISALGFRSMIIDDGWSYDGCGDGAYSYCGAWEFSKEKFPDMKGFVKKAHESGIKVALWFPLPFIGRLNPDYELFADKMLADIMGAGVLDPRFPEVREYIVGSYEKIIEKYGLDGLKLDFLTDFNRPAGIRPGTDCLSVNEGVTKLLAAIEKRVRSGSPDMMIEYRQNYIGPSVIRHCNMLRVGDCAFDFITNRIGAVDLRMLGHPLAVHSDMLLWNKDETPVNIGVMLLNIMFSVPQISVLTAQMSEKQREVLKNFLQYWNSHRELLLYGRISVTEPQANYSSVSAEDDKMRCAVLYLPRIFSFDGKRTDLFNAAESDCVYVNSAAAGKAVCRDIYGRITDEITFEAGVFSLPVSKGGMAELTAM